MPTIESHNVLPNVVSNVARSIALALRVDRQGGMSGNLIGSGLCAREIDA
jgi:hypothetical protein